MTTNYSYVGTPVGELLLACRDDALTEVQFEKQGKRAVPGPDWQENDRALRPFARQLREYFQSKRRTFDVPLALEGTPFQVEVWSALREIPYGTTISYGELAHRVGRPKAFRAVGAANGRNPISIIVPCHRVIGSNGKLTGFGGGLPTKEALLRLERETCGERALFAESP